jgi:tRNA(Arg) A34 adenosine deaminase TadA
MSQPVALWSNVDRLAPQAEISALDNAGRLPAATYHGATMYTTLSPCDMCTGACIMYGVKRVVIGASTTRRWRDQFP